MGILGLSQTEAQLLLLLPLQKPAGRPMENLQKIKLIVKAIEQGDPSGAETTCRIHVKKAESNAIEVLQLQGEGP